MKISFKQKYFSLTVIAALLTACSQNEEKILTSSNGICFTASIGQNHTRATEESFEANDAISVFAFKNETGFSGEEYAHNKKYSFQNQQFTADEQNIIKQPADGSQLSYVAVYPYSEAADAKFTFQVKEDQAAGSNYTLSDLMIASTYPTDIQSPTLMFSHCLSSIVVDLSFAKAPAGNVSVKIANISTTTSVDLATTTFIGSGEANKSVIAAYNGTDSYKAILPPQTTSVESTGIEIMIGDATPLSYKFPATIEWNSGIRYDYKLYVAEDGTIHTTPTATKTKRLKQSNFKVLESEVQDNAAYGFALPFQIEFNYDEEGRLSKLIMETTNDDGSPYIYTESLMYTDKSIKIIGETSSAGNEEGYISQTICNLDENNRITSISDQYDTEHIHTTKCSYIDGYLIQIGLVCSLWSQDNWIQNNHWENGKITSSETLDQTTMEMLESVTMKYSTDSESYKNQISAHLFYETELMSLAYLPDAYFGKKMNSFPIETIEFDSGSHHTYRCTNTIEADEDGYITVITETCMETDENGNVIGREIGIMTFIYEE